MRIMNARLLALACPALLLASCGDEPAPVESDERTASGEVLEGSISDAMLPLDTVTSAPPLLRPEPRPEAVGDAEETEIEGEPGDAPPIAEQPAAPAVPAAPPAEVAD